MILDPIAEQLHANGYEPRQTSSARSSDGSTRQTWACVGFHPLLNADGSRRDYAIPRNLATLSFEYASWRGWPETFSPVAARLADALVELLAPTVDPKPRGILRKRAEPTPRPLVRCTSTSLQLVYRIEGVSASLNDRSFHYRPLLYPHGLATSDERAVLSLAAGLPSIPVGDAAAWADDRSPLTVRRDELPAWTGDTISTAVATLVQEWVAAGELRICEQYAEPAKPSGYYSPEAALARDGVRLVVPTDEWTGKSPGPLGQERGRWG